MYEVFLTQKRMDAGSWQKLICQLMWSHRLGEKVELNLLFDGPEVRIFLKTKRTLMNFVAGTEGFILRQTTEEIKEPLTIASLKPIILKKQDNLNTLFERMRATGHEVLRISFIIRKIPTSYNLKAYIIYEKAGVCQIARIREIGTEFLETDFRKNFLLRRAPKYLDLARTTGLISGESAGALLSLNSYPYFKGQHYVTLSNYDFNKHTVVFGASGGGKTKFLSEFIAEIADKYGNVYHVLVIDPHDAMRAEIGGLPDTQVYYYSSDETGIDLFATSERDTVSSTEMILGLFRSLINDGWNARLERLLRATVYLLIEKRELDLQNLRRVLTDVTYKNAAVQEMADYLPDSLQEFFGQDYNELKTQHYDETFARILAFIDELQLTPAFYRKNTKRLDYELTRNKVTLVSLSQTRLGEKAVRTLAGLIMNQLFMLGMERRMGFRMILVIDETAVVENMVLARMLSEARKYNITVILAGQYFAQVSERLKEAIFANVANYWCFRLNYGDAEELAKHLDMNLVDVEQVDFAAVRRETYGASLSERVKMLATLSDRQVVARLSKNGVILPAVMGRSVDFEARPEVKNFKNVNNADSMLENDAVKEKFTVKFKTKASILDLMREQSTSRKKVN